jgi:SAM-dependent methyltransferase
MLAAMYADVVDLRDFYATRLGQVVRRMVRRRIRLMWPDVHGMRVMGMGYAAPYLRLFSDEAERVLGMMPAEQGVLAWPTDGPNCVALSEEGELPLQDYSVDRVLLVHALEYSEHARLLLREVWRVLAGGGRLLAVVPNRRGIWARLERTPLGIGHPYSASQLTRLLRDEHFTPERTSPALFIPPTASRMMLRSAAAWEQVGERWFTTFAGVVLVEATKQIYAKASDSRRLQRRPVYLPMPHGATPATRIALGDS